jgi:DNA-binding NarL/FixJ family response regulator
MPVSVVIVEDNHQLLEGLSHLVGGTQGFRLAGAFHNCEEMLAGVDRARPDVALMDIGLPGMSGIEGVALLKNRLPSTEILMLTVYDDDRKIFDSLCAGASGYLLKSTPPDEILEAIREIHAGGAPMSPRIARRVLEKSREAGRQTGSDEQFSDRELEILSSIVRGDSYKMIAGQWSISVNTVRSHIKNIYAKLHVHSKSEAVAKALKTRLSREK